MNTLPSILPNIMLLAETISTTRYTLARTEMLGMWWHWLVLAAVVFVIAGFVIWMYRRDTRDLPAAVAIALATLRLFAFAGLLFFFMDLEKSTQRKVLQDSKVVMLLDASQSMGLEDADSSGSGQRRVDMMVAALSQGDMIRSLRQKHELSVMRFDESEQPIELASYAKLSTANAAAADIEAENAATEIDQLSIQRDQARWMFGIAAVLFALAIPSILAYIFSSGASSNWAPWVLLMGVVLLASGAVLAAVTNLLFVDISVASVLGNEDLESLYERLEQQEAEDTPQPEPRPEPEVNWAEQLTPAGSETRLGEALMAVLNRTRGQPIAGVILVSDGQLNAGLPHDDAIAVAREVNVPIYTVGMGAITRPANVAVVDIEAPTRVYPGDAFTITGFVQSFGLDGRAAKVELISFPQPESGESEEGREVRFEDERTINLSATGDLHPIKFDVEPDDLPGRRVYQVRITPPQGDRNGGDNMREAVVQNVERRTRVLLLAGGPTREFRFLRNQLYRDNEIIVDVFLQTARPGVSQEADEILYEFPEDSDALFEYDCIVAFDPDWQSIDEAQIRLLEEWIDRQAGGMIVVTGPVYTSQWASERRSDLTVDILKGIYPVVFSNLGGAIELGKFQADEPSPIEFTREGLESDFLWLGDNGSESQHAWAGFEGVYGYYSVKDVKPGATVYARFLNEDEAVGDDMPVYMAGHYYGAGRVFFLSSGEMWRLRALDPTYFETFYTKLIRHVSEGRLLRDSKRGLLMVERPRYKVGDPVNIQARLTDAQHRPLSADKLEEVSTIVARPDGTQMTVKLRNVNVGSGEIAGREGMYAGQFTALQLGDYNVQLTVPDTGGEEVLTQQISVRAPRKEIERPERNDALLADLASSTGGTYYNGLQMAVAGSANVAALSSQIEPRDRRRPLSDLVDKRFERQQMWWLLSLIAGALCLEWLIRRVSKLA